MEVDHLAYNRIVIYFFFDGGGAVRSMVITVSTMVEDSETGILSSADTIISLNYFFSSLKHHRNLNNYCSCNVDLVFFIK